jgi:hypothetical protein
LIGSAITPYTSTWQTPAYLHLEGLPAGEYTWQVRGRNAAGAGAWSFTSNFTIVDNASPPPPAVPAPYTDTMETNPSNWTGTGLWRHVNNSDLAHNGNRAGGIRK